MYMPEYYAERDKEEAERMSKLIQVNETEWMWDKYQVIWNGVTDPPVYEIYYKDFGVQASYETLEECAEWLEREDNCDPANGWSTPEETFKDKEFWNG